MTFCYIDIETIPTQRQDFIDAIASEIKPPATMKKAETIEAWEQNDKQAAIDEAVSKTALDGAYGEVVCIGYAFDDGDVKYLAGKFEADILSKFFHDLQDRYSESHSRGMTFVGHNLTAFDMRFIFHRAVVNYVKPPSCFPINPKSWDNAIFDTMTYWAGHGGRIGMDRLCKALDIPGKSGEFTWKDVLPAYLRGDFIAIGDYCKDDVEATRRIHKRLTFLN